MAEIFNKKLKNKMEKLNTPNAVKTKREMKAEQTKQRAERLQSAKKDAKLREQINKKWESIEGVRRYKYAAINQACVATTATIKEECFDGILLQLNERSEAKSYKNQRRTLRRIVEKRQAQSLHRAIGRTADRFANHMQHRSVSKSVSELNRMQHCA